MNTIELIRALTERGAKDFEKCLSWLNPLPLDIHGLFKKIDIATERLQYTQDRQGASDADDTSSEMATLCRLKAEIQSITGRQA